jgi:hypothetical protein
MQDDVEGWVSSSATDRVADYAARGRKHQSLSDELLTAEWILAFRRMADDVRDPELRAAEEDFKSEFRLRRKEPPFAPIRDDFERFIANCEAAIKDIRDDDPLRYEEINQGIEQEIASFKATRDRTKS